MGKYLLKCATGGRSTEMKERAPADKTKSSTDREAGRRVSSAQPRAVGHEVSGSVPDRCDIFCQRVREPFSSFSCISARNTTPIKDRRGPVVGGPPDVK